MNISVSKDSFHGQDLVILFARRNNLGLYKRVHLLCAEIFLGSSPVQENAAKRFFQ